MGLGKISDIKHFNSHAHVERDGKTYAVCEQEIISTHTLTWSVTLNEWVELFPSIFQLTRSRGAWQNSLLVRQWYLAFQLTRSRGAWHTTGAGTAIVFNFNSHAHVERDLLTLCNTRKIWISTHTLTWSVTWITAWARHELFNFNSHAHVERDAWR